MRKNGTLNPLLIKIISQLGHTESLLIANASLPIPQHVYCVDVSLCVGVPSLLQTLEVIMQELVIESTIIAKEVALHHSNIYESMRILFGHQDDGIFTKEKIFGTETKVSGIGKKGEIVAHGEFKQLCDECRFAIRTGECTPYANIILVGGNSF